MSTLLSTTDQNSQLAGVASPVILSKDVAGYTVGYSYKSFNVSTLLPEYSSPDCDHDRLFIETEDQNVYCIRPLGNSNNFSTRHLIGSIMVIDGSSAMEYALDLKAVKNLSFACGDVLSLPGEQSSAPITKIIATTFGRTYAPIHFAEAPENDILENYNDKFLAAIRHSV